MTSARFDSSAVTWSLPVRLLLSSLALVPVVMVVGAFLMLGHLNRGDVIVAFLLTAGSVGMCLIPRYLSSLWQSHPGWLVEQRQQRIREARLEEELAKWSEPPPAVPSDTRP